MAQWLKTLVAQEEALGSILSTHIEWHTTIYL